MSNRVLRAIAEGLKVFPELRVGQLIENAIDNKPDLFYLSDDKLAEAIEQFVKTHRGR